MPDVGDAAHPDAPADVAGYDPDKHRQTACMISSDHSHPGTQCEHDGDGYGGLGGVGVQADTLSTAVSAEAVASSAIIDIAAPADGVVRAAVIGVLLHDGIHHHC